MGGGLMQLVAYGAQDIYLTGNPQITFFKVVYRRHTNFSMELINQTWSGSNLSALNEQRLTCTIARNGDLLHRLYLVVESEYNLAGMNPGSRFIKEVECQIGGQMIDKHSGTFLEVFSELTEPNPSGMIGFNGQGTKFQSMSGMGGSYYDTNMANGQFWIPLRFWFCRNPGLALPLIALQYHEVKINLVTNKADTSTQGTEYVTPEGYRQSRGLQSISDGNIITAGDYSNPTGNTITSLFLGNKSANFSGVSNQVYCKQAGHKGGAPTYLGSPAGVDGLEHAANDPLVPPTAVPKNRGQGGSDLWNALKHGGGGGGDSPTEKNVGFGANSDVYLGNNTLADQKALFGSSTNNGEYPDPRADAVHDDGILAKAGFGSESGNLTRNDLYAEYIYLDTDERRRFAQVSHEYLIEQVQSYQTSTTNTSSTTLNFNHPVKELIWYNGGKGLATSQSFKTMHGATWAKTPNQQDVDDTTSGGQNIAALVPKDTLSANNANSDMGENYVMQVVNNDSLGLAEATDVIGEPLPSSANQQVTDNTFQLQFNGHDRMEKLNYKYFTDVQVHQHHTGYGGLPQHIDSHMFNLMNNASANAEAWFNFGKAAGVDPTHAADGSSNDPDGHANAMKLGITEDILFPFNAGRYDSHNDGDLSNDCKYAPIKVKGGSVVNRGGGAHNVIHGGRGLNYGHTIGVYSFALKPEEHQPSGTCNFSRIDSAVLLQGSSNTQLDIFAINYNVLRIMSGMGGLAYSN